MNLSRESFISDACVLIAAGLALVLYHSYKIPVALAVAVIIIAIGVCIINYIVDNYI